MACKRVVNVGGQKIGGKNPVVIKGMLKSALNNKKKALNEAKRLQNEGCQILRVAVEKQQDTAIIRYLKSRIKVPLETDIHFDYNLALASIEEGADSVRLNPMNIYKLSQVKEVARYAKDKDVPIRIGINSGGFKKKMPDKKLAETMTEKVLSYIKIIRNEGFDKIMVSAKTNSVNSTVLANRMLHNKVDFPIH